ncbi:YihY/virulence factor BrkB family protein [Actinopolymorpha alba]|uniref:YihY/virulence factor BrkB family protein n=1 Tax=Actinopolymorpha alba TaxID=533267 RepID=UPI00036FA4FC|nr:YihY/virulence factor BrkB family protein [Actinopolymorpha alba]
MRVSQIKQRVEALVGRTRERSRLLDHLARALAHYQAVLGSQLAAAATYFAFLSFFPLMALTFAAVGYVVVYVPGAERQVTAALTAAFPGMIGTGPNQINVMAIASQKAGVGIVGLLVLLYSGLGWISALRSALQAVFEAVAVKKRNFLVNKAHDLLVLVAVGIILVISVGLGTSVTGFTDTVLRFLGLAGAPGVRWLLVAASIVVGIGANTVLFFTLYRLLPRHEVPARALWQGALLAGVGFEILKQLASLVIGSVTSNPLYGAFAIMVALLIWINYFDRLAVLGAAWAVTAATSPATSTEHAEDASAVATTRGEKAGGRARNAATHAVSAVCGALAVGWLAARRRRAVSAERSASYGTRAAGARRRVRT